LQPRKMEGSLWIHTSYRQVTPEFRLEMERRFGVPER
jgi:hypothetical protein